MVVRNTGVKPLPSKQKRVLVTGFDAFDRLKSNPSQTIVETLGNYIKLPGSRGEIVLDTMVLPTCCKAWAKLKRQLDANSGVYTAVILTGVAAKRQKISLERFALNIRDYRIEDNGGHKYEGLAIANSGPDALKTGLSIDTFSKSLTKNGSLCEVSNHAGSFICNEIYYKCLLYQGNQPSPADVLFVHLPLPRTYVQTLKSLKSQSSSSKSSGIELMKLAVEQIIQLSAR